MTGERVSTWTRLAPQPGERRPAPGALALVQGFANTHFDLEHEFGTDVLRSPEALAAWLHRAELLASDTRLGPVDLERGLELRAGLREAARAPPHSEAARRGRERLDALAAQAPIQLRFTTPTPELSGATGAGFPGAVAALLAISAQAMLDGRWSRLKVCPGHHCGWLFYDHSRNRSGRWCSMSVCGGREKARAHYRRQRGA
ncbi:MAG: CGNR zinc finger domain-containing protein [Solirubrobacteraceae bacterium]